MCFPICGMLRKEGQEGNFSGRGDIWLKRLFAGNGSERERFQNRGRS